MSNKMIITRGVRYHDFCRYLGYSHHYVRSKIINRPDFPKPIAIFGSIGLWNPDDIRKWKTNRDERREKGRRRMSGTWRL